MTQAVALPFLFPTDMASINQIADILAERTGRTFDVPFQKELKVMINYWATRLLKNSLEKHPIDRKYFYFAFTTNIVPIVKTKFQKLENFSFVTEKRVPNPLRVNNILFDYVGSSTGNAAYGYHQPEWDYYDEFQVYTNRPKYVYMNNLIYIKGIDEDETVDKIGVRGIFEDMSLRAYADTYEDMCFDPESVDTIPQDLVQPLIQAILNTELKLAVNPPITDTI